MENTIRLRQSKGAANSGISLLAALIAIVSVYTLIIGVNMTRMHA